MLLIQEAVIDEERAYQMSCSAQATFAEPGSYVTDARSILNRELHEERFARQSVEHKIEKSAAVLASPESAELIEFG